MIAEWKISFYFLFFEWEKIYVYFVLCFLLCRKVTSIFWKMWVVFVTIIKYLYVIIYFIGIFLFIVLYKIDCILHRSQCAQERQKKLFQTHSWVLKTFSIFSNFFYWGIQNYSNCGELQRTYNQTVFDCRLWKKRGKSEEEEVKQTIKKKMSLRRKSKKYWTCQLLRLLFARSNIKGRIKMKVGVKIYCTHYNSL